MLQAGERKAIQGDRIILVPGPADELDLVRDIFRQFVAGGMSRREIARQLNARGAPAARGARWTEARVRGLLTNRAYVGVLVFGRFAHRFRRARPQPQTTWVRATAGYAAIVSPATFALAQQCMRRRKAHTNEEGLLAELRAVLADHGRLSAALIDAHPAAHARSVYIRRFGGLTRAYERIGYAASAQQRAAAAGARRVRPCDARPAHAPTPTDEALIQGLRRLLAREGRISVALINADPELLSADVYRKRFGGMAAVYAQAGYAPDRQQRLATGLPEPG
ncbi:recombinase family protein [Phenylobacterium sp.]|uniref:recombinase family protein n=1 Tax=Phenylobacterium sp. TaxID=1871053 RepID=UPI002F943CCC